MASSVRWGSEEILCNGIHVSQELKQLDISTLVF